jgi:alkanesulfonate monooxygenase SsuD/methylene tetrahydromethanopterin reductase-like flavin-dependent oxidoreductase (luciferase family)
MPVHDFPNNLAELLAYLGDGLPADHPFAALHDTLPNGHGGSPDPWLLGSSPDSAAWAGEVGLPYCIADFINSDAVPLAKIYRDAFRPSRWLEEPYVMVASWVIAANSKAEGELIAVPSVETAEQWAAGRGPSSRRRRTTLGSPAEVRIGLDEVATLYGADELMLVNIMPDHSARCRSYELIAQEYGLVSTAEAA